MEVTRETTRNIFSDKINTNKWAVTLNSVWQTLIRNYIQISLFWAILRETKVSRRELRGLRDFYFILFWEGVLFFLMRLKKYIWQVGGENGETVWHIKSSKLCFISLHFSDIKFHSLSTVLTTCSQDLENYILKIVQYQINKFSIIFCSS